VGGPSELKVADFLPFLDSVSDVDGGHAAGDLRHADVDDGDLPNVVVGCVDHHDLARGHCAEEGLAVVGRALVVGDELRLVEVVGARDGVDVLNGAVDGGVPPVVVERAQEGLVDRPSLEVFGQMLLVELGCCEHVCQRVDVVLQPEGVGLFDVGLGLQGFGERGRFAGVDDDVILVGSDRRSHADLAHAGLELS
jgi:hypothetical protein